MRRDWTESELVFLKNNYPIMSASKIALELNRSLDSVKHRCRKLNLRKERICKWTKKNIINTFSELKKQLGRTPRYEDVRKDYSGMLDAIHRIWGKYNDFLKSLNLSLNQKRWGKKECIAEFEQIKSNLGKVPTIEDLQCCFGLFKAIIKRWKTYNNFLKELGYEPNFELKWSKERCIKEFSQLLPKSMIVPTAGELREKRPDLLAAIFLHCKSYRAFLIGQNLSPYQESWSKAKCISIFRDMMSSRLKPPSIDELAKINSKLLGAIYRHFNSYNLFLQQNGYEVNYGFYDEKWEKWENFVIKVCKELYPELEVKPRLGNNKCPDIVVQDKGKVKIIDAKLNVFCKSIGKNIINYKPFCDSLEFWCFYGKRKNPTRGIIIKNRKEIKNLLQKYAKNNLANKLDEFEQTWLKKFYI